ncbi:MAG: hypothetical protein FWC26_06295 [Fibromonadales bacterium]|nr:hypothetical protein [Fibromonadales bacterium]
MPALKYHTEEERKAAKNECNRKYNARNSKKRLECSMTWRKNNREKYLAQKRRYNNNNNNAYISELSANMKVAAAFAASFDAYHNLGAK